MTPTGMCREHLNSGAKAASPLAKGNKGHTHADNASTAVYSNAVLFQGILTFISGSECYVISHGHNTALSFQ